jgi:nucleotide-binding universal stress UspA family protein
MTSLVVGHSRDPASQQALRVARDLAERLGARLHVVHGIDLGDYPIDPDAADWEEQAERTLAEQHDQVQAALATCPQEWTYRADRGGPVGLISGVAEEKNALMIIVGTRGGGLGSAIERMLSGRSVSRALIRRQHRPVLVVHAPRSCLSNAREAEWGARPGPDRRSTSWSNPLARRFGAYDVAANVSARWSGGGQGRRRDGAGSQPAQPAS